MTIQLNSLGFDITLLAIRHGVWVALPVASETGSGASFVADGVRASILWTARATESLAFELSFTSPFATRVRLRLAPRGVFRACHLIPGNIHGDNNAAHVRAGEFPVLASDRPWERNRAPLWELRADRASHPVSMVLAGDDVLAVEIDPYSDSADGADGFIRNGVFAELPAACGVSLGYGNDPQTFVEKTNFSAATSDLSRGAVARGTLFAVRAPHRAGVHQILRAIYDRTRERPSHTKGEREALRALADAFAQVSWSPQLQQYTNRKCLLPGDRELKPWRAIVEIGWTGGSMMAYPFVLAEKLFPDLRMPRTGAEIFDQICAGANDASGLINDTSINSFTRDIPPGWNKSTINGWWSGFLPHTRDNHCAYTNAHAAYYLLKTIQATGTLVDAWMKCALGVLDTAVELQRQDGAFGYIFSATERKVVDWDGFAGCWFAAGLARAWKLTSERRYLDSARRAMDYYRPFVTSLAAWGSPMDTCKSVDSEGNLAFIRAARLLHEWTGEAVYLDMLREGAHYEYLWRYGFRTRPECPPLKGSDWNSCGGSITSVSNPHLHPMSVVVNTDLEYLTRITGDDYHLRRAEDGRAWLLNTMELYPDVVGYGRYGVLSERTCPSDGLLAERYYDTGAAASTWWSYNAWAAASAMEALAEHVRATSGR